MCFTFLREMQDWVAMDIADWLSQYMVLGAREGIYMQITNQVISLETAAELVVFFVFQDTNEAPKNMQKPVTDQRESKQAPKSKSTKDFT